MERSLNSEPCHIDKASVECYFMSIGESSDDKYIDSRKCQLFDMLPNISEEVN